MRFIDECELVVVAGDGGDGAVAFRREKYLPFGGPSGGDGGRGGNVYFEVDSGLSTLSDLQRSRTIRAGRGQNGQGKDRFGAAGEDVCVRLPPGTIVFDRETNEKLVELTEPGQRLVIAQGGTGGRGNIRFVTPVDRAPRRAEPGGEGQTRSLRLELKLMADVGLLGFPNVGKSTLIRAISRARPKVASYPFTTLTPQLGVVNMGDQRSGLASHFVVADIPGLIPGASQGTGLGIQFLRHLERTRIVLHLVSFDEAAERDPLGDYFALRNELAKFDSDLAARQEVVVLSKLDITETRERYPDLAQAFASRGITLHAISAATREGLDELLQVLRVTLEQQKQADESSTSSPHPGNGSKSSNS